MKNIVSTQMEKGTDGQSRGKGDPTEVAKVIPVTAENNVFAKLFGPHEFKQQAKRKPFMFPKDAAPKDQTAQTGLAEILFPEYGGIPGAYFTACRVVMRRTPDKQVNIVVVMPSTAIGPTRHPILNTTKCAKEHREMFSAYVSHLRDSYIDWRQKQVASGVKDETFNAQGSNALIVDASKLTDLGITFEDEDAATA